MWLVFYTLIFLIHVLEWNEVHCLFKCHTLSNLRNIKHSIKAPPHNACISRTTALSVNPRRIEFGDGASANHAKSMIQHTLLTAKDEIDFSRQYKEGVRIETHIKKLEEKLGTDMKTEEVAKSLDMKIEEVFERLKLMQEAKTVLTTANMRLVFHIARYYKFRGLSYPDLVQEGTFGLIKAIEKFDPDKGFRFSTYASWWIKQAVSRAIAEKSRLVRLPVHIHDMMVSISKVEREIIMETSRKPSAQEVSRRLGLPVQKVEMLMRCSQDLSSIDESAYQNRAKAEASSVQVKDHIASASKAPSELSARNALRAELREAMAVLSDREAQVLELRFGLSGDMPLTLEDIGKRFSVTRERIRQIEARALSKLRHPSKKAQLAEIFQDHSMYPPTATAAAPLVPQQQQDHSMYPPAATATAPLAPQQQQDHSMYSPTATAAAPLAPQQQGSSNFSGSGTSELDSLSERADNLLAKEQLLSEYAQARA